MKRYELSDEERADTVRKIQENRRPRDPRQYPRNGNVSLKSVESLE